MAQETAAVDPAKSNIEMAFILSEGLYLGILLVVKKRNLGKKEDRGNQNNMGKQTDNSQSVCFHDSTVLFWSCVLRNNKAETHVSFKWLFHKEIHWNTI